MGQDVAHEFCRDILQMYRARGYVILLVTGRPEEYRRQTEQWLQDHEVEYDQLLMREAGDFRQDFVIKQELYQQVIKDSYNIFFVLDDRDQVVKMWRSQGLTCLQVAEGNF
jgi:acid phosphatase class B